MGSISPVLSFNPYFSGTSFWTLLKEMEMKQLIRRMRRQDGGYTVVKL